MEVFKGVIRNQGILKPGPPPGTKRPSRTAAPDSVLIRNGGRRLIVAQHLARMLVF